MKQPASTFRSDSLVDWIVEVWSKHSKKVGDSCGCYKDAIRWHLCDDAQVLYDNLEERGLIVPDWDLVKRRLKLHMEDVRAQTTAAAQSEGSGG